jgi:hypothetical protein
MLGKYAHTDLELESLHTILPLKTAWGKHHFTETLQNCSSNISELKRKQLPLLGLRNSPDIRNNIRKTLEELDTSIIDDLDNKDARITDSVQQILWDKSSIGNFLNTSPLVLKAIVTWKTIVLPGFALVMPLLALIVPYIYYKFSNKYVDSSEYLLRVRGALLQQISVPSVLTKWRGTRHDRLGFLLESLFIGLTLAMFISSLWNQVATAFHQRNIWNDLVYRGQGIQKTVQSAKQIIAFLHKLPLRNQKALRHVIESGESALDSCSGIMGLDPVPTFGYVWNNPDSLTKLKSWLAHIDVIVSIAGLDKICFPSYLGGKARMELYNMTHPFIKNCTSNSFISSGHSLVTGPNRGGKSTFCKALGLAIVTAQSWGFAFAHSMRLTPFAHILTALEPSGKLGEYSTFESEIQFAKSVLAADTKGAVFVMMDEIFHSTNANDGVAASKVFMDQLYTKDNIVSLISTHYRELTDAYKEKAQLLQLLSDILPSGRLLYKYKLATGVSSNSSVMEILIERGLVAASSGSAAVSMKD